MCFVTILVYCNCVKRVKTESLWCYVSTSFKYGNNHFKRHFCHQLTNKASYYMNNRNTFLSKPKLILTIWDWLQSFLNKCKYTHIQTVPLRPKEWNLSLWDQPYMNQKMCRSIFQWTTICYLFLHTSSTRYFIEKFCFFVWYFMCLSYNVLLQVTFWS